MRKSVAHDLLQCAEADLEITTRKLRNLFRRDMAFCASSGFCSWQLFVTLRGFAMMLKSDVQESERLNKCLSLFGERCPGGSLDLCSSRAAIKHYLGRTAFGPKSGSKKFSEIKPAAKKLFQECMAGWQLMEEVESQEDRFKHAEVRRDVPTLAEANRSLQEIDPAACPPVTPVSLWATSMNTQLNRFRAQREYPCAEGLPAVAFVLADKEPAEAQHLWLVTDKVRTAVHFVACKRHASGKYYLREPLVFLKSHDILARFYKMVRNKLEISVVEFMVRVCRETWLSLRASSGHKL